MIKAMTFSNTNPNANDRKLEQFCLDNNIGKNNIIKIYFYALPGDSERDDAHYCKLVYDDRSIEQ